MCINNEPPVNYIRNSSLRPNSFFTTSRKLVKPLFSKTFETASFPKEYQFLTITGGSLVVKALGYQLEGLGFQTG
jgi:hypothetical protein